MHAQKGEETQKQEENGINFKKQRHEKKAK